MANVKISGLPAATSVTAGTDVAPLVSGGITTKATPQQIVNAGLLAPGAIGSTTPSTGKFTTVESTIATGTAPFTVASTTNVANLNASSLNGATFASPGAIGSGTASTGAFTTLSASSTVSGTGFSTYLASPPAIGSGTASTGAFTTLSASSTVSGTGFSTYLASPPAIGGTAASTGKFTDLTSTGNTIIGDASTDTFTVYPATVSLINSTAITAASTKTLTLNGGAGSNGLVVDASNNVGIGAASSGEKLDVSGSIRITYASGFKTFTSGGSSFTTLSNTTWNSVGNIVVLQNPYSDIVFATATSGTALEKMRLDTSGNLTVPNIYTNTTASVTYVAVSSTGLLQRGGVSALKYKQDIRDLESIDITKFRPVRYKSKCENDDQTIDYFGFIADEVEKAGIKELVTYNDDGEPEGFQYERMTVVLLKNIQELTARLEALEGAK